MLEGPNFEENKNGAIGLNVKAVLRQCLKLGFYALDHFWGTKFGPLVFNQLTLSLPRSFKNVPIMQSDIIMFVCYT